MSLLICHISCCVSVVHLAALFLVFILFHIIRSQLFLCSIVLYIKEIFKLYITYKIFKKMFDTQRETEWVSGCLYCSLPRNLWQPELGWDCNGGSRKLRQEPSGCASTAPAQSALAASWHPEREEGSEWDSVPAGIHTSQTPHQDQFHPPAIWRYHGHIKIMVFTCI